MEPWVQKKRQNYALAFETAAVDHVGRGEPTCRQAHERNEIRVPLPYWCGFASTGGRTGSAAPSGAQTLAQAV